MPSSSACSVNTWLRAPAARSRHARADARRRCPRRCRRVPISSSSVGSVVGNCGQRISSACQTGRCGMRAAAVGAVVEAELLREAQRVDVHLPAGGAVRARRRAEDLGVALARALHLARGPCGVGAGARRPASARGPSSGCRVSKPASRTRAHHVGARAGRCPGPAAACRTAACARRSARRTDVRDTLLDEARPEHAPDRAAGVVGPEREQERRAGRRAGAAARRSARHALARAAQRVDVDLQGELRAMRGRSVDQARARRRRGRDTRRRSGAAPRPSPPSAAQSRSAHVLSIFGTRFCTSW